MKPRGSFLSPLGLVLGGLLLACSTPIELTHPPARKADLFPTAKRSGSLVVAVDTVQDPRRAVRYFGFDMEEHGLLPAQIIVTNLGDEVIEIDPADVLVHRGRAVIDPVSIESVARLCQESGGFNDREARELIDAHFAQLGFGSTVIAPGETIRGWIFFEVGIEAKKKPENPWFRVVSLHGGSDLSLRIAVTESDSQQRLHFGPYRLGH